MIMQRLLLAGFFVLLIGSAPAYAEVRIFLCSADIPGESTVTDFEGCNELLALGERIEFLAEGADKPAKEIDLLPIELRKQVDLGTPVLRMLALTKKPFDGVVSFRRSGDVPFVFLEIDLLSARVVNARMDEEGVVATERVTLLAERIAWTYTMQNEDDTPGAKTEYGYDVESGMSL